MEDKEQWYSNKNLFEMMQNTNKEFSIMLNDVKKDINDLRSELTVTRYEIKQYNNLRGTLGNTVEDVSALKEDASKIKTDIENMKAESKGKQSVGKNIVYYSGWIFGLITLVGKLLKWF